MTFGEQVTRLSALHLHAPGSIQPPFGPFKDSPSGQELLHLLDFVVQRPPLLGIFLGTAAVVAIIGAINIKSKR